jgi:hypothetical protein
MGGNERSIAAGRSEIVDRILIGYGAYSGKADESELGAISAEIHFLDVPCRAIPNGEGDRVPGRICSSI